MRKQENHSHSRGKKNRSRFHPHHCIGTLPRVWEKQQFFPDARMSVGILPRVWEKEKYALRACCALRDTPTCVGKSVRSWSISELSKGYSHVCGKKTQCFQAKLTLKGNFVMRFFTNLFLSTCQNFF